MKMKLDIKVMISVFAMALVGIIALLIEMLTINKFAQAANQSAGVGMRIAVIGMVLLVAGAVWVSYLVKHVVGTHAQRLSDYAEKIADGDMTTVIEAPYSDEFVAIYEHMNEMVKGNKIDVEAAKALAEGNLAIEIKPRNENDLLGVAFRDLIKVENEVISGIKESTYQLTTGAEQVAAASQSLAQGSTEQASAIEEITVSMKDIEDMTTHNAQNANKANEIVLNTKNAAELGNEKMNEMKNAMNEINESSEKISKIIKVIDDISFQTNILALNAAVEAARAGTHGKGFAVVAEQIRELAGKSATAAAETAEMIDESIRKAHNGSQLAESTATALNTIMEDIEAVVDITSSITKASNEQASAVSQIDQAIMQVSQVVQNNSATSEECAAASEELSGQSYALREMISRYNLKTGMDETEKTFVEKNINKKKPRKHAEVDPESVISLEGDFGKY